jgi:hypothetical protein
MNSRRAASPERSVRARGARAISLEAAVERPRRIDNYIDYFASGYSRRVRVASDRCGEALLGGDPC